MIRRRVRWPQRLTVIRARSVHEFVCLCWQCADKTGHLEVDLQNRLFFCHRHGGGGKFPEAAMPKLDGSREALETVRRIVARRDAKEPACPENFYYAAHDESVNRYLREQRGLTDQHIEHLKPHLKIGDPWRVYFPVFDDKGAIRSFVGRAMKPAKLRYWTVHVGTGPTFPIWGCHRLNVEDVVCVEGILDAVWKTDRLAMLSHRLSSRHLAILRSLRPRSLTFAYDNDIDTDAVKAAYSDARRAGLFIGCPVFVARLPINKDPDSLRDDDSFLKRKERVL